MDDATQKQGATEQRANDVLERAETLTRVELFGEAVRPAGRANTRCKEAAAHRPGVGPCQEATRGGGGLRHINRTLLCADGHCPGRHGPEAQPSTSRRHPMLLSRWSPRKGDCGAGVNRYMGKRPPRQLGSLGNYSLRTTVRSPSQF